MSLQKMEFRAETRQILDLVINSLYSHKEIFLRELLSNASDAIDKARFDSLTERHILEGDENWKIRIVSDGDRNTLTISDNGIGMTKDEAIKHLGTIAHSGTGEFLAALKESDMKDRPKLIGQFGVGFYSAFMVADRVTVITRKAGNDKGTGVQWESSADGSFSVEDVEKDGRGTDVILHLKQEEKKYLDEWEIRDVIKKYSDFIEHPIVMDVERDEESAIQKGERVKVRHEETLNSQKAIWVKNKSDIAESEYHEFYKHISHDYQNPSKVIHYHAEGANEFVSLLFIPSALPFDIFYKDFKSGPALYVKRVKIMDHCEELLPQYLRFVKGVVDSSDLPLNVSREILQNNRQIEAINKSLTKKVLDTLEEMKNTEYDRYLAFHKEFGKILKEGVHFDYARREAIAELLLFKSTMTDKDTFRSVTDYLGSMKEGQEDIYYITSPSYDEAIRSPYLEAFREKDYEVFIMLDEIDDIVMGRLEYKGKKFKSIVKGEIDLDKEVSEKRKTTERNIEKLLTLFKDMLKDDVKDVRFSHRLRDSACCLVADENALDPQMEKLMESMGQVVPKNKKVLEINPAHPLFEAMNRIPDSPEKASRIAEYASMLYNMALLLEGSKPKDSAQLAKATWNLMVENAGTGR